MTFFESRLVLFEMIKNVLLFMSTTLETTLPLITTRWRSFIIVLLHASQFPQTKFKTSSLAATRCLYQQIWNLLENSPAEQTKIINDAHKAQNK